MANRLLNFMRRNKDVIGPVGTGAALNAGLATLGAGPVAGLAYGVGDFAVSYPATLAARALGNRITKPIAGIDPKFIRAGIENITNIGASLGSMSLTDAVVGRYLNPQPTPINMSQEQQLMQEMAQRAAVNDLDVQAVAPGTQFQTAGLEFLQNYVGRRPQSNLQQYLDPGSLALLQEAGVKFHG